MPTAFVPRETCAGESRVAVSPETVKRLVKLGLEVALESGAGKLACISDASFEAEGARICAGDEWGRAELVLKVQPPSPEEAARLKAGAILVCFMAPAANLELVRRLCDGRVSTLAMDLIPRITRAQSVDALSSQATVAGYKAVLLGASHLPKMCPLLMTAAGTVPPSKVVVFGAGVAGLMAIATARRLGAKVEATDVRAATKEQVESLGATFIEVPRTEDMEDAGGYAKEASEEFLARQRAEVAKRVADADLVITTAQVPGKRAPLLVTEDMLQSMRPGSVVVDLAVDSGGNCAGSVAGEIVVKHGVTLVGTSNLPATVALHASELYAKNVLNLVKLFVDKEGQIATDFQDEILAGCLLTHAGEVRHGPTAQALTEKGAMA
jgi:NAD(P) transhydrogenase subunit alpha